MPFSELRSKEWLVSIADWLRKSGFVDKIFFLSTGKGK